jgi:hypothetical protein
MSTSDPDFYEAKKFSPEPDEEPTRRHGCFFYGCLITGILGLLLLIAAGLITYVLYRSLSQFVDENTATAPRELPKVEVPPEARQAIKEKVDAFDKAADVKDSPQTLVLTADELNALIDESPDLKGQIYLTMEGDQIKGKLSIRLEKLSYFLEKLGIGLLRGRYFNGEVELKGSFSDGTLKLMIESLEVNGRRLPQPFVTQVTDMIVEFSKDPRHANEVNKIESIEIKDGKLIIKTRVKNKGTGPSAPPAPHELPDHVLTPPDSERPAEKASKDGPPTDMPTPAPPGGPAKKP